MRFKFNMTAEKLVASLFITLFLTACTIKRNAITNHTGAFVKGADIGWLPEMEATGYHFYNDSGLEEDCFKILKDHGINTIRLRAWVNPSGDPFSGHCSTEETVAMAVRAKKWGMRILIDLHYSDSWADPGK